jgi:hypothetical protein
MNSLVELSLEYLRRACTCLSALIFSATKMMMPTCNMQTYAMHGWSSCSYLVCTCCHPDCYAATQNQLITVLIHNQTSNNQGSSCIVIRKRRNNHGFHIIDIAEFWTFTMNFCGTFSPSAAPIPNFQSLGPAAGSETSCCSSMKASQYMHLLSVG